jgi:hypothetical protein
MRCLDYARHDGAGRTGRHSRKKRCSFGQKEGKKLMQAIPRSMFVENKRTFNTFNP